MQGKNDLDQMSDSMLLGEALDWEDLGQNI